MLDASLPPCRHYHPAGVGRRVGQLPAAHAACAPRRRARPPGLFNLEATSVFTRVAAWWLACHPVDDTRQWASDHLVSLLPAIRATGPLALDPGGTVSHWTRQPSLVAPPSLKLRAARPLPSLRARERLNGASAPGALSKDRDGSGPALCRARYRGAAELHRARSREKQARPASQPASAAGGLEGGAARWRVAC